MTHNSKQPPKPKPCNLIDDTISTWKSQLPGYITKSQALMEHIDAIDYGAPKRWVVYPPMVLLPSGNADNNMKWCSIAESSDACLIEQRERLWISILEKIEKREGKGRLTHLAVNARIPLHTKSDVFNSYEQDTAENTHSGNENILRVPTGLVMLYGNFGPSLPPSHTPTPRDFEDAFWVSTKQNGITQVWAPRYTMFSRGNVKEKTRLLTLPSESLSTGTAIDLYVGIGYFVFSFVKLGMRVMGWELNPWSVEGLRRGAVANKWSIRVVREEEEFELGDETVLVFAENNQLAEKRLQTMGPEVTSTIKHVNCGLLPTSELTWELASHIVTKDGWLHLHENVGVDDIQTRKARIEDIFQTWLADSKRTAKVEHVELVKTFAPRVWHCVFDVHISASDQKNQEH